MERKIIQVIYNLHESQTDEGIKILNYEFVRIGDEKDSFIPGAKFRKCIGMKMVKEKSDRYIEVEYNDGTYDCIYNFTHIILADEMAYNRIIKEQIEFKTEDETETGPF